jgi:hypothetical protein
VLQTSGASDYFELWESSKKPSLNVRLVSL